MIQLFDVDGFPDWGEPSTMLAADACVGLLPEACRGAGIRFAPK